MMMRKLTWMFLIFLIGIYPLKIAIDEYRLSQPDVLTQTNALNDQMHVEKNTPQAQRVQKSHIPYQSFVNHTKVLFSYVHNIIWHAKVNHYQLGGNCFNKVNGVYGLDCSAYIDHVLKDLDLNSYRSIAHWSRNYKPTSEDYYDFFNELPNNKIERHWFKIQNPLELQPGDILVFKYKNSEGKLAQGHVMVVMAKPIFIRHQHNVLLIKISDDAPSGHSYDTRTKHASGIGIGDLLLKINSITKKPIAYAWRVNAAWEEDMNFAMARPIYANQTPMGALKRNT